jgi:uncharacterized protein
MKVDVHDIAGRPGVSRPVRIAHMLEGLSTEMVAVAEPVRVEGLLEGVEEGVLVTGHVRTKTSAKCARCLKEFSWDLELDVRELYTFRSRQDEDFYPIEDGEIDLEACARDAVLLSVPFAPLCKEDCLGLCARCGGDRNLGECACGPDIDDRWAALSSLKLEDN